MVGTGVRKIKINNSEMVINCCSNLDFFIKCPNSTGTIGPEILYPASLVKQLYN